MYCGVDLSTVSPDEQPDLWFDFWRDLAPAETIASAVFSLQVAETETGKTADTSPADHLFGSASIAASFFNTDLLQRPVQRLQPGCVDGNRYRIICLATSSLGQKLELFSHFWCRAPA